LSGKKTPREDTKKFLLTLAAYKHGAGDDLWRLAQLDIVDKHHVFDLSAAAFTLPTVSLLDKDGKVLATMSGHRIAGVNAGFLWQPTTGVTHKFQDDYQPAFDVVFVRGDLFPFKPVLPTLLHLANVVRETLGKFEEFERTRG
jgi:hypothetical protein